MDAEPYKDTQYSDVASSSAVPGLFTNFHTAATLLRMARSELRIELLEDCNGAAVIDNFFRVIDAVEASLGKTSPDLVMETKFIVEVEGLDGSGKTTLVTKICEALPNSIATKTPSTCLKEVRPLWDHRGGNLARAFYMISNYVLEYEIFSSKSDVIIIDRWYASTCAYSVAHQKCSTGTTDVPNIMELPDAIFEWPSDLCLKPHILLVLQIDGNVRRQRVQQRASGGGGASMFNPWDDRLDKDPALGSRILEALGRIQGPRETHSINANLSIEEVVTQALDKVKPALQKHLFPQNYFSSGPLEWWRYMSQKLRLCDNSGQRSRHALWNLHVSYNIGDESSPVLKTVGLDRIDRDCVYYWTANSAVPPQNNIFASILWTGGAYPTECQWRSEGYLTRVTTKECTLRGFEAPSSLAAHVTACVSRDHDAKGKTRSSRSESYDDLVHASRQTPDREHVCMIRFVPIRVEVLRGGPSTRLAGYPQRWEWSRGVIGDWTIRSILPFSGTIHFQKMVYRHMTIAILGTHASGKSCIGSKLAELLGFRFDPELGSILRDTNALVENGHLHGNGSLIASSRDERQNWDDDIFNAESQRDNTSVGSRVVETWHPGNAAWYQYRNKQERRTEINFDRYKESISKHQENSLVLLVQLTLESSSIMVQRRHGDPRIKQLLPMKDDGTECHHLHEALQSGSDNFLKEVIGALGIPYLRISNDCDGESAMDSVLSEILLFVQSNYHRLIIVS